MVVSILAIKSYNLGEFMKKVLTILVLALTLGLASSVVAQSVELNGSYMFSRFSTNGNAVNVDPGWDASINMAPTNTFGIVADFSGAYFDNATLNTFGAGPQLTYRKWANFQPYVHFLMGDARFSAGNYVNNSFYFAPEGGVDYYLTNHFGVRAGLGYVHTNIANNGVNGMRVVTGITYRF